MTDTYFPTADYASLIAALLNSPVCPITGKVTADQIKTILGDHGIWPEAIRADVLGAVSE